MQNDISQAPSQPQYPFGPTVDEALTHKQIVDSPVGPPGNIVQRLGQQFQMPAASPTSTMSNRPGNNLGEIG